MLLIRSIQRYVRNKQSDWRRRELTNLCGEKSIACNHLFQLFSFHFFPSFACCWIWCQVPINIMTKTVREKNQNKTFYVEKIREWNYIFETETNLIRGHEGAAADVKQCFSLSLRNSFEPTTKKCFFTSQFAFKVNKRNFLLCRLSFIESMQCDG